MMLNNNSSEQAARKFAVKKINAGYIFEALHVYADLNGNVVYWRIRLKHPDGDKWIRPMYKDSQGAYHIGDPPELRGMLKPLYGQQLLPVHASATLVIVEGEMPADKLNTFFSKHGANNEFVAITSGSSTSADNADWQPLANRKCIIWPDNDDVGFKYAKIVYTKLIPLNCKLEIMTISSTLPPGGDCVDWLEANPNSNIADIIAIPRSNKIELMNDLDEQDKQDKQETQSQATDLVAFVLERAELFHDNNKEVFALDKETKEVRHIDGRGFRDFMTSNFYEHSGKSVRDQSWREASSTLSGIGRHRGECHSVHRRVAKHEDSYYLDLCQANNSAAIKISAGIWEVIASPPVRFVRSETMQMLPVPIAGGTFSTLWKVCNIPNDSQLLALAWLVDTLRSDTPYPVLELLGEQGSAKSTTQTALRRIIDPNACDLRAAPKQPEDLYVSANLNHIVSCENISHLSAQMQDALCVIATGGAFAKRKLYTDGDESVIYAKNPVILNGIAAAITAQDLIDRSITIELPVIAARVETTDLWLQFDNEYGAILGALLDVFAKALAILPHIKLQPSERPRLLEFARLGMAVAEAMGATGEDFMIQFTASRQESLARTIDASPVACAVIDWFEDKGRVAKELPVKDLFSSVEYHRPEHTDAWPKTAKGFADALRRAAPALRQLGIECRSLGKVGSYVKWRIAPKIN